MTVIVGDCVEEMAKLPEASVDAVVTDPPYGIRFMGKAWDGAAIEEAVRNPRDVSHLERLTGGADDPNRKLTPRTGSAYATAAGEAGAYDFSLTGNRAFQVWTEQWAREAFRVLKPGGHLLCFAGTRTYHRMAAGVEDAGFEIRDCIAWMYGSGFPKSHDVSQAIDAAAGAEREVVGMKKAGIATPGDTDRHTVGGSRAVEVPVTAPATEDAKRWQGWGTALKPAFEPVVVARKPLVGTVAVNVLEHGTGALSVDGCRIAMADEDRERIDGREFVLENTERIAYSGYADDGTRKPMAAHELGRWPANVVLDESAADALDAQTGERAAGRFPGVQNARPYENLGDSGFPAGRVQPERDMDSGGASRFFYCAKTSRAERNAGLDGFEARPLDIGDERPSGSFHERLNHPAPAAARNHHPTVKPIALMRWLTRLVTPPGGTVLEPFAGSGTTAIACVLEGFNCIAIERELDYARIAEARTAFWREHGEKALEYDARKQPEQLDGQLDLFAEYQDIPDGEEVAA